MSADKLRLLEERTSQGVQEVGEALLDTNATGTAKVPEVTQAYELALANPHLIIRAFYNHLIIVNSMATLSLDDLKIIGRAHEIMKVNGVKSNSASAHGVIEFLNAITEEQRTLIQESIELAASINTPFFREALENLTKMMHNGHVQRQKNPNWIPTDGDSIADNLIWGHTDPRMTDPMVLTMFTMAHYIEQFMSIPFTAIGIEMANHKDWFLNAFTDVLALNYVRGEKHAGSVGNEWAKPRSEGGLGWLKQERIDAFNQSTDEFSS